MRETQSRRFQYELEKEDPKGSSNKFRQAKKVLKSELQQTIYGYRKPISADFRVVDYLADEYGFDRKDSTEDISATGTAASADLVQQKSELEFEDVTTALPRSSNLVKGRQDRTSERLEQTRQERTNERLEQVRDRMERFEKLEQKSDKQFREQEMTTTTTTTTTTAKPKPVAAEEREVEGRPGDRAVFVKPVKAPSVATRKSIANKISVHQLVSEAMPTLQMSIVPVYFVNKSTKNVMAIPYLVMKSTSKMPLLPGMFDGVNGVSQNILNFQHSPLRAGSQQRNNFRSGSPLLPLLGSMDRNANEQQQQAQQLKEDGGDAEGDFEVEPQNGDWAPLNDQDAQYTEQNSAWWRK
ncbi:hypothetical protein HDE_04027 [Halotydeus destructor]|nr:hypothetical protein HDE_04027 [Halotydeus destructor]